MILEFCLISTAYLLTRGSLEDIMPVSYYAPNSFNPYESYIPSEAWSLLCLPFFSD